jgi:hypothetical protein
MTSEIKLIGIGLAVILLALGGYFGFRYAYDDGEISGKAQIQTAWDADRAAIQKLTDTAIAAATKQRDEALTANEAIQNDYQTKLSAANANAADFSRRLSNALSGATANRSAVPQAGAGPSPATASTPSSAEQLGKLVGLTADLHAECVANSAQLNALIAEIKPQL